VHQVLKFRYGCAPKGTCLGLHYNTSEDSKERWWWRIRCTTDPESHWQILDLVKCIQYHHSQ